MCADSPSAAADIRRQAASRAGWAAGTVFLLLMAAGADRPPPPGFLFIVVLAAGIVAALRRGLPRLLTIWEERGARAALFRAGFAGCCVGAVFWAMAWALPLDRPAVVPLVAQLTGLAAVCLMASVAAGTTTAAGRWLEVRSLRRRGLH